MASKTGHRRLPIHFIVIFGAMVVGIAVIGYLHAVYQTKNIREAKEQELSAVAGLKVKEVVHWRKERLDHASFILGSPFVAHARQCLKDPLDADRRQVVLSWMTAFKSDEELTGVFLIDAYCKTSLSVPEGAPPPATGMDFFDLMRLEGPVLTDIQRGNSPDDAYLCLIIPLFCTITGSPVRVGTLLFQIDPSVYLFPLIRTWPAVSPTAESLLLRDGAEENLRPGEPWHRKDTGSLPQLSAADGGLPAGEERIVEATDYRGVRVLAALRTIPDTQWSIVAKVDKREVYAPIYIHAWYMVFIVGGVILLAGAALGFFWSLQSGRFYLRLFEAERQKAELALRHEYLTRYANDILLLADSGGRIVDANERAVSTYGYGREELIGLRLEDLQEESTLPFLAAEMQKVREKNGHIFETVNRRRDGTAFPVEVSARYVEFPDCEYYWATVRDISERKRLEALLLKERDRAQDYLDIAAVSIFALDKSGCVTLINKEGARILGYSGEELTGGKWFDLCVPGNALEELKARFQGVMAGRLDPSGYYEAAVQTRTGKQRVLAFHYTVLRNEDSEITGILNSGEDVTERRRAERERLVTIELFKIINSAKSTRQLMHEVALSLKDWTGCDATGLRARRGASFPQYGEDAEPREHDPDRQVTEQAACCEASNPRSIERPFFESVCKDLLSGRFDPEAPCFTRHGSFWTNNASRLHAGGAGAEPTQPSPDEPSEGSFESVAFIPVRTGDQTLGLLQFKSARPGFFSPEDISFLERLADGFAVALAKMQAKEEWLHLAAAVEQAAESFILLDSNRIVRYANPAFERLSGYSRKEFLQGPIRLFRSEFQSDSFYENIWKTVESAGVWNGTIVIKKKDGTYIETETTISPVFDDRGKMVNSIIIKRDLSLIRRLESQLRQAQKMEAIGTLAGGIAHDFNNILASIIGFTELALSDIPEETETYLTLEQVLESADRARELVKQILAFSRKTEQECKPVQVGLIVKEALRLLRASLPTTIEVRHSISPEAATGTTLADPTQIHQILMNLCTNAAHSMRRKGGLLRVSLADVHIEDSFGGSLIPLTPGPFMRLSVSDTGHGMEATVSRRIFEPYFTTKEQGEGTGLGLSVVYGIVKDINGGIGFESEPGKGTTFHVFFPKLESAGEKGSEAPSPVPAGKGRILFLDDEPAIALVGKRLLERLGFTVVAVTSSREGLGIFRKNPDIFDLVITDYTMPQLTGIALAERLIRIRPDIPIILCTGFIESIEEESLEEYGIRELLTKPINLHTLATTVHRVLHEKRG